MRTDMMCLNRDVMKIQAVRYMLMILMPLSTLHDWQRILADGMTYPMVLPVRLKQLQ